VLQKSDVKQFAEIANIEVDKEIISPKEHDKFDDDVKRKVELKELLVSFTITCIRHLVHV
jgi:hypothetical protein